MPRVSEEHLERRRQQILDAAQRCFARKGFFETSMQDVFAESGLSAGAVYRYFKSKNDLVAALAGQTSVQLRAVITAAVRAERLPTPAELVHTVALEVMRRSGPDGMVRLAPQAWALALVNEEAAVAVRGAMGGIRDLWFEYAARMRDAGLLTPDADVDAVAKTLITVLPGFILEHLILGDVDADTLARGVEALMPMAAPLPSGRE
ncbi:TetR/AcrR family transcriptional regulator [Nocardia farcinica]|uniref:TetR/AcrR family transcriptional regulator n=1 Tax=Nocardia farcinica TaxID=37329 RepID=UPI0018954DEE|nr:TetR/AcrR family transcriptional regulator [Nocardia farcinica]MBF6263402.1 TetR/AcrR family transcriptional regulator [Nocardia farcinica]MBF6268068.1 TetR/AcrR family transcriptional regulator [Nocardia farcinica]MBF6282015.1 TetR/AcrR family transcriptional regulator [Nocardia farcinica]MBF6291860.1 TetR/AcrR family transcriptional regulator [Nocardia farcinica]MBF6306571.1 TetR/AcrR family transcriptional regulator [Nocardia farcinica]